MGIDTGGTFTDAALVVASTSEVLAWGKAPTTRHDLAVGIIEAVRQLPPDLLPQVGMVSLSTTLATNSIVEGRGAPVCLVLIGQDPDLFRQYDLQRWLPTTNLAFVAGGHDGVGQEREPLDETAVRRVARDMGSVVSAFAVSGFFGVRNPAHELRVREILMEETGLPVTCGHELASELDAVLRAATSALNASLIPLLRELMLALRDALTQLGVQAPAMVVRGDGSLMRVEMALERPVETILSGPAASVVGAQALAGLDDMLVVDIGGTTTDLAAVHQGRPRLSLTGARVGRWRTLVRAVETVSSGLGGDSLVAVGKDGRLRVGPERAWPVSYLASTYDNLHDLLEDGRSRLDKLDPPDVVLYTLARSPNGVDLTPVETRIMEALAEGPQPLWRLATRDPWVHFYLSQRNQLEAGGMVARSTFTPTDALHVLGHWHRWDADAAGLAAEITGWFLGQEGRATALSVMRQVRDGLVRAMITLLVRGPDGSLPGDALDLLGLALDPDETGGLEVNLRSRLPIVGLGAPAAHFVVPAAEVLRSAAVLPPHHAVANAVGAVCGSVVIRETTRVLPVYASSGLDSYVVTGGSENTRHDGREEAVAAATYLASALATEAATRAGAVDVEVTVDVTDEEATPGPGFKDRLFLGSTVVATATGRPRFALHETANLEVPLW